MKTACMVQSIFSKKSNQIYISKEQEFMRTTFKKQTKKNNLPSKLILATLVYLFSPAFSVTALKSTVTASFDGVVRTLC